MLKLGVVPILNENDAVSGNEGYEADGMFSDNDGLAALVAEQARRRIADSPLEICIQLCVGVPVRSCCCGRSVRRRRFGSAFFSLSFFFFFLRVSRLWRHYCRVVCSILIVCVYVVVCVCVRVAA